MLNSPWLFCFLVTALECDFPILEAICHARPLQVPVEIWRELNNIPDNRLLIELRNILKRNQWRIMSAWQHKYVAISGKNVIYFNWCPDASIYLEERFNDLGISILKLSNGYSTWKIHQINTFYDSSFLITKPVGPNLSLAQEMFEFSQLFWKYRTTNSDKKLTLNDFSEFLWIRQNNKR